MVRASTGQGHASNHGVPRGAAKLADEAERLNVRPWPLASLLRADLVRAVDEAAREADGHARLEETLRRLG